MPDPSLALLEPFDTAGGVVVVRVAGPALAVHLAVQPGDLCLNGVDLGAQLLEQDPALGGGGYRRRANIDAGYSVHHLALGFGWRHALQNQLQMVAPMGVVPAGYNAAVFHPVLHGPVQPFVVCRHADGNFEVFAPDQVSILITDAGGVGFPLQGEEVVVVLEADCLALTKEHRMGAPPNLGCDLLNGAGVQVVGELPPIDLQIVLKGVFGEPILLALGIENRFVILAELVALLPVFFADSFDLRVPEVFVDAPVGLLNHALVGLEAEVAAVV